MAGAQGRRPGEDRRRDRVPRRWVVSITIALALPVAGCARGVRPPCDNPPPLYVMLQASDHLNPNDSGRSLTTEVQLLQLKGLAKIENARFEDIWFRGKEILGEDLVQMDEKFIDPGASLPFGLRRDARANYVAVVANFRKPTGSAWRSLVLLPLPPEDKCTPQPVEVMQMPGKGDAQLKFFLEQYRIENRTPAKASRSITGDRGVKT